MKKTTLAAICLPLSLAVCAEGALVASYQFTGGSLADGSGNGNTASIVGTVTGAVSDGVRGDVFDLSGAGNGVYLSSPLAGAGTGSWTLALWLRDTNPSTNSYFIDTRDLTGGSTTSNSIILSTKHNSPGGLGIYNGSGWATSGSVDTEADSSWHHVVWAFDSGASEARFYVDGVENVVGGYSVSDLLTNDVRLGNRSGDGGAAQSGRLIDDVNIFSHALTQQDVENLIPEPTSMALLGLGALAFLRRRR